MIERILEGLEPEQVAAVKATRGPVCILAGAGTGKTTTITRRIAYQIASGAFRANEILAVTFTDRAANEMRSRLESLSVGRVRARTFHAEALAQLAHFGTAPQLLDSKARVVGPLIRRLPAPYKFRATKDVAGEIERAKNRRVTPSGYLDDVSDAGHTPPLPPDVMARVYGEYEARKRRMGRIDFEDLLEETIRMLEEHPDAVETIRSRYLALTVDEYQDVNLLQQSLLEAWLGPREEVCVVGDDYQSIFAFTGATPAYLVEFASRFPNARVVTLEQSHRSTPQVVELANRLASKLGTGGSGGRSETCRAEPPSLKVLRSELEPGPEPALVEHATAADETDDVVVRTQKLIADGVAPESIAVLYRINARSEDFEEAFAAAGVAFQVRDGAFLRRPGSRGVLQAVRSKPDDAAHPAVARAARELGWSPDEVADGVEEIARQADLGRMVRLAEEHGGTVRAFVEDLRSRFAAESEGRGVVLSTYHRAKGLEFDAVFLPRLEERELPFALSRSDEDLAEERRLLYVGITRARTHLVVSWSRTRDGKSARQSRYIAELIPQAPRGTRRPVEDPQDPDLFARLRAWRARTAAATGVPPYVVFHDTTLRAICEQKPRTLVELSMVSGVGPTKLSRYGSDLLAIING
jgi:DNA helicase-2/ATP-dependent DNA helicase PcrA